MVVVSNLLSQDIIWSLNTCTSLKASTQADEPLFDQYTLSLLNESSMNQIFTILSRTGAVNFFNFRLLQLVVMKFGNQNLKDQVEKYGEEVTKFMKETKFTDFYRIWLGQSAHGSVPNYQLLVVKLDRKWPEATLFIIDRFNVTSRTLVPRAWLAKRSKMPKTSEVFPLST